MEQMVTIDIWSDNWKSQEILNILHDIGVKTAGMTREVIGNREEEIEWQRCKDGEVSALVVTLFGDAMKSIGENVHEVKDVEEKPLFLYKLNVIDDVPDTVEDEVNITLNVGLTTEDGEELDMDEVVNVIGALADCTIIPCIGFYKGKRERSLKVEVYGYKPTPAFELATHLARVCKQECVALTIKDMTTFVTKHPTWKDYHEWMEKLN